jgi:hypothetical protein
MGRFRFGYRVCAPNILILPQKKQRGQQRGISARITEKRTLAKNSYATFSLRTVLQALQAI